MKYIHWSAQNASAEERLCDISAEFRYVDVVCLTGTGERRGEVDTIRSTLPYHTALRSGWSPNPHTNRSC
eukprot:1861584-Pyramimonas_sp.AAC.1